MRTIIGTVTLAFITVFGGVLVARPAMATTLAPAQFFETAWGPEYDTAGNWAALPGTENGSGAWAYGSGSSGGTTTATPDPSVTASANATGSGISAGFANEKYYFELVGPSGSAVPVLLAANGSAAGGGISFESYGELTVSLPSGFGTVFSGGMCESSNNKALCSLGPYTSGPSSGFDVLQDIAIVPNTEYMMSMTLTAIAGANCGSGYDCGGSSSASIDPSLEIDPSFGTAAAPYQLVLSDNIGDPPVSVPEPGTVPVLVASLVAFVISRRLSVGWRRLMCIPGDQCRGYVRASLGFRAKQHNYGSGCLASFTGRR